MPNDRIASLATSPEQHPRTSVDLLVSVRSVPEAQMALSAGVPWIDLKEPSAGALGAPDRQVAEQVALALHNHAKRSVALGELINLDPSLAIAFSRWFPVMKVGLAGAQVRSWQSQISELSLEITAQGSSLVPVIYGDWKECSAPSPEAVLECASSIAAQYVLIDTYYKRGQNLVNFISLEDLHSLADAVAAQGCSLVVAGSLTEPDATRLRNLPLAAIGVRGAVCAEQRESSVCPEKLRSWVHLFSQT